MKLESRGYGIDINEAEMMTIKEREGLKQQLNEIQYLEKEFNAFLDEFSRCCE